MPVVDVILKMSNRIRLNNISLCRHVDDSLLMRLRVGYLFCRHQDSAAASLQIWLLSIEVSHDFPTIWYIYGKNIVLNGYIYLKDYILSVAVQKPHTNARGNHRFHTVHK